jgi:outer membrane protein TolC
VLQESLEIAQLRLQATLTRQAAGAANQSQVLQARINVTSAANDLSRGERDALTALTALSRTLGVAVTAVIGPAPSVTLPDGLDVTASIGGRTDVIAAGLDVHEAEIALAAARRNAGPTADARMSYSASFEEASAQLSATFDTRSFQPALAASISTSSRAGSGTSQTIRASLGVSIPIDPAGSTAVQAAEISLTQATSNLTRTIATAQIEVQNLQRSLASAQAQLELTQLLVTQSTTALKQARTRLDLGSISILELKESEIALLQAQLQLMRSADAHNSALLALAAALGLDLLELLR